MYETMAYWEAAHTIPGQQQFVLDFARQWQAADKVVYARTWPGHVAPGRASSGSSMPTLPGDSKPTPRTTSPLMALNSPAIRAGLVDVRMIVCPAVVGGGKRFFPDGVRLDLGLLEERRLDSGVVILRYGIQGTAGR